MSYSVEALERAARLVREWGVARLPGGQTLADALTVRGLSLWDVASPNLAAYYLPPTFAPISSWRRLQSRVRPHASRLRQLWRSRRSRPVASDGCGRWPAATPVLMLGFSSYMYRDVLRPVADRLALPTISIWDPEAEPTVRVADEDRQSVWEHWDAETAAQARDEADAYQRALAAIRGSRRLSRLIRDGEAPMWRQAGPVLDWLFWTYFPALLPHVAVARHILRRHRPSLIVSADVDDKRNRIYGLLGRQLGIPWLEVQFGTYGAGNVEWQFLVADRLALWGEQAREFMLTQHIPADRLTITGSPRNDAAVSRAAAATRAPMARLGVGSDRVAVVFACVFSGLVDRDRLTAVNHAIVNAAAKHPKIALIVKPHPGEPAHVIEQFRRSDSVMVADKREDIRELIWSCDAFVTLGSTSTMDALIAGKPVIWPDLFDLAWWDDEFKASGATMVARSQEELEQFFGAVADGTVASFQADREAARERFIERMVYRVDGHAAQRIADLAVGMAGSAATGGLDQ